MKKINSLIFGIALLAIGSSAALFAEETAESVTVHSEYCGCEYLYSNNWMAANGDYATLEAGVDATAGQEMYAGDDWMMLDQPATLSDEMCNNADQVFVTCDAPAIPFVTTLFYNGHDVTAPGTPTGVDGETEPPLLANYLYNPDWDLTAGFTTNAFEVGLTGTSGSGSSDLSVNIVATQFRQQGTGSCYGPIVTINPLRGIGDDAHGLISTACTHQTNYTITAAIPNGKCLYACSCENDNDLPDSCGGINGNLISFELISAPSADGKCYPSGRYLSTVTLTYSIG
jgi:hypothetical protein